MLEFITSGCIGRFDDEEVELMTRMSLEAQRPLNWNVLGVDAKDPDRREQQYREGRTEIVEYRAHAEPGLRWGGMSDLGERPLGWGHAALLRLSMRATAAFLYSF